LIAEKVVLTWRGKGATLVDIPEADEEVLEEDEEMAL